MWNGKVALFFDSPAIPGLKFITQLDGIESDADKSVSIVHDCHSRWVFASALSTRLLRSVAEVCFTGLGITNEAVLYRSPITSGVRAYEKHLQTLPWIHKKHRGRVCILSPKSVIKLWTFRALAGDTKKKKNETSLQSMEFIHPNRCLPRFYCFGSRIHFSAVFGASHLHKFILIIILAVSPAWPDVELMDSDCRGWTKWNSQIECGVGDKFSERYRIKSSRLGVRPDRPVGSWNFSWYRLSLSDQIYDGLDYLTFKRLYFFFTNFDRQTSNYHRKIIIEALFHKLANLSAWNVNLGMIRVIFLDHGPMREKCARFT